MENKEEDCGFNLVLMQNESQRENADVWGGKYCVILLCRKIAFSHSSEIFEHSYVPNKVNL